MIYYYQKYGISKSLLLLFLFYISSVSTSLSSSVLQYSNEKTSLYVGENIEIFSDETSSLSAEEVLNKATFVKNKAKAPNLGVTGYTHWLKFTIENLTNEKLLLLELASPIIDQVSFYHVKNKDTVTLLREMGEEKVYSLRNYNHPDYIFNIDLEKGSKKTYLLKIKSGEQILTPLLLGSTKSIFDGIITKDIIFGLYIGVILVMLIYNLFVFFSVRDKVYLYYVIYILFVGLTQTYLQGYTYKFLWPNSPWMAIHSMFIFPPLVGIAISEFIKVFLQTKKFTPKMHYGLYIINAIYVVCIILGLSGQHNQAQKLIDLNATLISLYALAISIVISLKKYRPAQFFLIAWSIFFVGIIIFIMKNLGVLPYNNFTNYTMTAGSAIEVTLLSLALADRINILKREKEESDQKQLEALQENERIVREQNVILETKVENRTEELRGALSDLRNAQSQLVDSEKMASLGQLTAGIAHEINNPINFVTSNVNPLKQDIDDIISILDIYHEASELTGDEQTSKLKEAKELEEDLELDYIKKEMTQLLSGIDEGASRTAEIVRGLRTFSRLDENELKTADINEGLKSTLVILNTNINQEKIILDTSYAEIPEIECFPGKLNQVFMNIITNGIQATQKNPEQGKERKISVVTRLTDQDIEIKISDNGKGMSEEVKSKIFDPFYTTKDVGEGTGLGLSIAYSIINDHQGKISVESTQGVGSDFIIKIPIPKEQ